MSRLFFEVFYFNVYTWYSFNEYISIIKHVIRVSDHNNDNNLRNSNRKL